MCCYYDVGCTWIGPYCDLSSHEAHCWNKQFKITPEEPSTSVSSSPPLLIQPTTTSTSAAPLLTCKGDGGGGSGGGIVGDDNRTGSYVGTGGVNRSVAATTKRDVSLSSLDELSQKLCRCERVIAMMRSETASVRSEVSSLREDVVRKDVELVTLKKMNSDVCEELSNVKQSHEDVKEMLRREIDTLKYQNVLLENRLELLTKHLEQSDVKLLQKDADMEEIKAEVGFILRSTLWIKK